MFCVFLANIPLTGLNTKRFDSTFLEFQISRAPPCLFLQSLMGNYDISALSCISNTEATVSISEIKMHVHASNAYLAQMFTVIL